MGAYGVNKHFPGVHAVKDATLEIAAGRVHCLIGENGAGKSTLVKMLAGVYRPESGEIRFGSEVAKIRSPQEALQRGVRTIFQEFTLVPDMTVAENIFLGREPCRVRGILNRSERHRQTRSLLEEMGIKRVDPLQKVRELGVAHQQMIEIAKASSLSGGRILIMDEPTAALTASEIETLFALIRGLRDRGLGIVYITHRLEEVHVIGDAVTVMRDGAVVLEAPTSEVSRARLIEAMIGRQFADLFPPRDRRLGEVVFEVRNASVRAKVHDVSFTVRRGEVVALFGLVGAGRTELVRALIGADKLSSGAIEVNGQRRVLRSPGEALATGIGFVPEDRKRQGIIPLMTVASNISLSSLLQLSRGPYLSNSSIQELARSYAKQLDIRTPSLLRAMAQLSGGTQQKAIIARALAANPDVVILDEPTRGVDVGARTELYRVINRLCADGRAVLIVTSDLTEAIGVSDRILVMRQGRLVGELPGEGATERALLELAFGESAQQTSPDRGAPASDDSELQSVDLGGPPA